MLQSDLLSEDIDARRLVEQLQWAWRGPVIAQLVFAIEVANAMAYIQGRSPRDAFNNSTKHYKRYAHIEGLKEIGKVERFEIDRMERVQKALSGICKNGIYPEWLEEASSVLVGYLARKAGYELSEVEALSRYSWRNQREHCELLRNVQQHNVAFLRKRRKLRFSRLMAIERKQYSVGSCGGMRFFRGSNDADILSL